MKMNIRHCFNKTILLITKSCCCCWFFFFFLSNKLQKFSAKVKNAIKFHQEKITKTNISDISISIELK